MKFPRNKVLMSFVRLIGFYLVLFTLFFCQTNLVKAQSCTLEEEKAGSQHLAMAKIYEERSEWEEAIEIYTQLTVSPCNAIADEAFDGLQRTVALKSSWYTQVQEQFFAFSLSAVIFIVLGALVFFSAKVFVWTVDKADKWIVMPFIDLTGNESGDAVAESLVNKVHEIRLLLSKFPNIRVGFSKNIDLPSFTATTHRNFLLSAVSSLDSLDVSGIGLPVGSSLSSVIRWLDFGGHRLVGSIQQWENRLEINVRLEEGRAGKCTKVWKIISTENTNDLVGSSLVYLIDSLAYRILFDITPEKWGTSSATAFQAFLKGIEHFNTYYDSHSRDTEALQKAKTSLLTAVQVDPTYQPAIFQLALAHINKGEYDEAIILLKGILKHSEFQPEIYYNLGVSYYQKTNDWAYSEAERFFREVLDGFSNTQIMEENRKLLALTHCGLVSITAQHSRVNNADLEILFETGTEHYKSAIKLAEEDQEIVAQAKYSLALLHLNRKEFNEALLLIEDALAYNPYHWRGYTAFGQTAAAIGAYDIAINSLKKATLLSPDYEYAYYQLGRVYMLSNIPDKALLALEAFSKAPTIASAHNEKGKIYAEQLHNYEEGIRCFINATELNSKSAEAYANIAWYLAEGGLLDESDGEQATVAATRAVEITQRKDWHKLAVLGRVYYGCGEFEKARLALNEASQLDGRAPQVYYHLAQVYFSELELQQARQHLIALFKLEKQGVWKSKGVHLMREIENQLGQAQRKK